ncbi:uncharacterized protein LOC113462995 [Phoenix dactylifera]|uniref:Uncharacterized protein LOC113462995 n=1 Tax=Phoenix dactylifera TaxID=42345 RepID=A0A8B9ADG1_PHODC|nr:uncharacterized protein LOC113462995 [Phoenix dactylifera]
MLATPSFVRKKESPSFALGHRWIAHGRFESCAGGEWQVWRALRYVWMVIQRWLTKEGEPFCSRKRCDCNSPVPLTTVKAKSRPMPSHCVLWKPLASTLSSSSSSAFAATAPITSPYTRRRPSPTLSRLPLWSLRRRAASQPAPRLLLAASLREEGWGAKRCRISPRKMWRRLSVATLIEELMGSLSDRSVDRIRLACSYFTRNLWLIVLTLTKLGQPRPPFDDLIQRLGSLSDIDNGSKRKLPGIPIMEAERIKTYLKILIPSFVLEFF